MIFEAVSHEYVKLNKSLCLHEPSYCRSRFDFRGKKAKPHRTEVREPQSVLFFSQSSSLLFQWKVKFAFCQAPCSPAALKTDLFPIAIHLHSYEFKLKREIFLVSNLALFLLLPRGEQDQ